MGAAPVAGKRFIAIAGNMGAGKTELTKFLCRRYGIKPFYEPNDQNPYLADFYRDMKTWAFRSQLYFLAHKFRLQLELQDDPGTVRKRGVLGPRQHLLVGHEEAVGELFNLRPTNTYKEIVAWLRVERGVYATTEELMRAMKKAGIRRPSYRPRPRRKKRQARLRPSAIALVPLQRAQAS